MNMELGAMIIVKGKSKHAACVTPVESAKFVFCKMSFHLQNEYEMYATYVIMYAIESFHSD
jgi:hypothetical protein